MIFLDSDETCEQNVDACFATSTFIDLLSNNKSWILLIIIE